MKIALNAEQIWHNIPYNENDILTSEDLYMGND